MARGKDSGALYALGNIDLDNVRYAAGDKLPAISADVEASLRAAGVVSQVPPVADDEAGLDTAEA